MYTEPHTDALIERDERRKRMTIADRQAEDKLAWELDHPDSPYDPAHLAQITSTAIESEIGLYDTDTFDSLLGKNKPDKVLPVDSTALENINGLLNQLDKVAPEKARRYRAALAEASFANETL